MLRQTIAQSELEQFKGTLQARQADLTARQYDRDAMAIETSADELERIQRAQERDFAIAAIDRESLRLREIRAALQRIERGTFGCCVNCEEDISAKRLSAAPWSALCIVCQESAERTARCSSQYREESFSCV